MNGVRAADHICAGFGETEKPHLALAHQVCHRADRFFDRCVWINPMQIIEINYIDIEPAQTTFARFAHIIGLAADPAKLALVWITQNSKFRRYDDLSATSSQCAPEQLLIGVRAIHVGRIEECDAELE